MFRNGNMKRFNTTLGLSLMALVFIAGCGDPLANSVSGKVTLDGQAVSGTIRFVGANGNEVESLLGDDGSYTVVDPPKGEVQIAITAPPDMQGDILPDDAPDLPDMNEAAGTNQIPPPEKYSDPAKSNLTFTVTTGKQTHDIPLTK